MLNQIVIAGRLLEEPIKETTEDGKTITTITVIVPRPYKNIDGIYENDYIKCILWNGIANATADYCHKGDIVGVKGRLQTNEIENEDGTKTHKMDVVAEKVSFLSSKRKEDEE